MVTVTAGLIMLAIVSVAYSLIYPEMFISFIDAIGPKFEPREGRDYTKFVDKEEGLALYNIGGILSPMKPRPMTLSEKFLEWMEDRE